MDTANRYAYWRRNLAGHSPENPAPARLALYCARADIRHREMQRAIDWDWDAKLGYFAEADVPAELACLPDGYSARVYVADDCWGVEWGNCEPSDEEREAAGSVVVRIDVTDPDGFEVASLTYGGFDFIDLPGYVVSDWKDAVCMALYDGLLGEARDDALDHVASVLAEQGERAFWEARDVATV